MTQKVDNFQSNLPLVDVTGRLTVISAETLAKLVDEVRALRAVADDHETRITALEP